MADKISTVVLKVDLECDRCYKKIRRVLCKIQDKENIKTISFDEKSNVVMVAGPFDAERVCDKLCSKAGRVIKEIHIKGKENKESKDKDGGDKAKAAKPEEKGAGKPEKADGGGKKEKDAKPEKEAKQDKATAKPEKEKVAKDVKPEKKVKFDFADAPPAAEAKPAKAMALPPGFSKADLAPFLEKMKLAQQGQGGHEPPMMMAPPVAAAQGVAVPSIWPAPAGSVSGYNYNPAYYDQSSYYGGGCGGGCRCGSCCKPAPPGGYYGVPVYDNQGWYYGNRQPYYQHQPHQQQQEDPNATCSVM